MSEKPSYYAILTAEVRYAKNLTNLQKLLYAEITALSEKDGFCWASNEYFAKLYDKHNTYISQTLSNMNKKGYIDIFVDIKSGNKRKIYIGGIYKNLKTSLEKPKDPSLEKPKDNTTSINTKTNKRSQSSRSEISYQPITEKNPGCPQTKWRNKKRAEIGKQPTYSQNTLLEDIRYFKDEAMRLHGISFETLSAPSGKMLKGFKNVSKYAELKEIVDWWLKIGGEYADYTPDAFISESTINKYEAKNNKKPKIYDDV